MKNQNMTIYTFGYAGHTVEQLAAHVTHLDALVVDVRYSPFGRANPTWSRTALQQAFGARYVWVREFGNVNYANGGPIRLADPGQGLAIVDRLVAGGARPPIFLCACRAVEACHRRVVAEHVAVAWDGAPITHLGTSAPTRRPTTPSLF